MLMVKMSKGIQNLPSFHFFLEQHSTDVYDLQQSYLKFIQVIA